MAAAVLQVLIPQAIDLMVAQFQHSYFQDLPTHLEPMLPNVTKSRQSKMAGCKPEVLYVVQIRNCSCMLLNSRNMSIIRFSLVAVTFTSETIVFHDHSWFVLCMVSW